MARGFETGGVAALGRPKICLIENDEGVSTCCSLCFGPLSLKMGRCESSSPRYLVQPSRSKAEDEEDEEEEEAARRDGVFPHGALALLLSGIKERRPHKSRSSYLHVFLYPSSRTKRMGWIREGGGRLNGKLEGPGESRGETHQHLRATEESAVSGSGVEAGQNAALLPSL